MLDVADVRARASSCLAPGTSDRLGIEVEWIVVDPTDPLRCVSAEETRVAAGTEPLPGGGAITIEPGGQLELSAAHRTDARSAVDVMELDADALKARCAAAGLELAEVGLDPLRATTRSLLLPRYEAMQTVFDAVGPSPMRMATGTASVQLNVDFGDDPMRVWRLAGLLGPMMLAAFANSPIQHGRPTGWKSTRQLMWYTLPGGRADPVPTWNLDTWVDHVLETDVLLIRTPDGAVPITGRFSFRTWTEQGHEAGYPDLDDLDYHLTTLFPPVRPRGWVELRMIDCVAADGRAAAAALATTLLRDLDAGHDAAAACLPIAGQWVEAAQHGCASPRIAAAAKTCFEIAAAATPDADLAEACREWSARYPQRGRCPADDRLDEARVDNPRGGHTAAVMA